MILSAARVRVLGFAWLLLVALPMEVAQALELSTQLDPARLPLTGSEATTVESEPGEPLALQTAQSLGDSVHDDAAGRVIGAAIGMLGMPYQYGADNAEVVDCSGLMRRVFGSIGQQLPRTAHEMLSSGHAVGRQLLRKGDLLFYRWQRRQLHVAVYVDNNTIIHASPKAGRVVVAKLTPDWQRRLIAVRRLI